MTLGLGTTDLNVVDRQGAKELALVVIIRVGLVVGYVVVNSKMVLS